MSGRKRMGKDFALSNPYFEYSELGIVERDCALDGLNSWLKEHVPEGGGEEAFALFKFCFASFVFHHQSGWIDDNTHIESTLWCSPLWSEDIPFVDHVRTAYPCMATKDTPEITGLPIDTLCLSEIETLHAKIEKLTELIERNGQLHEDNIVKRLEQLLDMRSVRGKGYALSKEIHAKLQELLGRPAVLVEPPPPPSLLTMLVDNICFDFGDFGRGGLDVDEMEEDVLIPFESQTAKVTAGSAGYC